MAKPTTARAFAKGAIFGASAAMLATGIAMATGGAGLFLPAMGIGTLAGAAGLVGEFMAASLGGAAVFAPLFAATDFIVHTIPGLDKLVGADRIPPQRSFSSGRSAPTSHLPSPDRILYKELRSVEKTIHAQDYVHSNHAERLEAERAIAEQHARDAATAQR